ncbi:MAG TPA: hypothetical protein ENH52_14085 [Nitrospirae bacterium]|nr:hypothetical protein [Nitrospirota bacterium]
MKNVLSITEARKKLPGIIKSLKDSPDNVYRITVHDEIVAEIKSPSVVRPGEAAARLIELRKKVGSKRKGHRIPVSENIKKHLYVAEDSD